MSHRMRLQNLVPSTLQVQQVITRDLRALWDSFALLLVVRTVDFVLVVVNLWPLPTRTQLQPFALQLELAGNLYSVRG